jgi:uncharacterized YccA/Bax inhibitor family protein
MSLSNPNPVLKSGFAKAVPSGEPMTMEGAVSKSGMLIAVVIACAVLGGTVAPVALALPALVAAFVLGLVTSFKPHLAQRTAVPYAVLEGLVVGLVSSFYADAYGGGIVVYAFGITVSVFAAVLALYATRVIKATENFKLAVAAATLGVMAYYLASFVMSLFGAKLPLIASSSNFGIAFSLFVVVLAAANLVMDFDFIERGVEQGAPKYMEWFAAFGLLVTLVWLYLEILRLLAKLQSRRD